MKKHLLLIASFIAISSSCYSQSEEKELLLNKSRIKYIESGYARIIKPKEALSILKENPAAYAEFKKAKLLVVL